MKRIEFTPINEMTEKIYDPPKPSIKLLPEWYKKISHFINPNKPTFMDADGKSENLTIKACAPFFDAITAGYFITLPCDIFVCEPGHEYRITWNGYWEPLSEHSLDQITGFPVPDGYESFPLKWNNVWKVKTPPGYSCLITHPHSRFDLPFFTIAGIIDTDVFPVEFNFPFFLKKEFVGIVPAGTPIAQIFPIKRDSWESKINKFNKNVLYDQNNFAIKMYKSYKNRWWNKKTYK